MAPWPGAGPPTATTRHGGLLSRADKARLDAALTSATIYDTGNVVLNGSTFGYYAHGLGKQPKFVQVYYDVYTVAVPTRPISSTGINTSGAVRFYYVDGTYVAIENTSTNAQVVRVIAFA
jgi:hypothetical protein